MKAHTDEQNLAEKVAELEAQKLQLIADFTNFRKRQEEERARYGLAANMAIVSVLIDIMDDLRLARSDSEMDTERAKEVLRIYSEKLDSLMDNLGLEVLELEAGVKFDPAVMEAVTTIPAGSPENDGTVAEVISMAVRYKGAEHLLRPAKVVVAKYTPAAN